MPGGYEPNVRGGLSGKAGEFLMRLRTQDGQANEEKQEEAEVITKTSRITEFYVACFGKYQIRLE